MRVRTPDIGAFGRALGLIAIAMMLVLAALHFRHDEEVARTPQPTAPVASDPVAGELARCQAIGTAAEDDANCKAAWAENRRRFFALPSADGTSPAPTAARSPAANSEDR